MTHTSGEVQHLCSFWLSTKGRREDGMNGLPVVCGMEKDKRPALQQEPNVYLEPKWLRCLQSCNGLEVIGRGHQEQEEMPEAVLGGSAQLQVILFTK